MSQADGTNSEPPLVIAVDLGGTMLRAALYGTGWEPLATHSEPTLAEQGPESVMSRLIQAVQRLGEAGGWERVAGVGISSPGPLDPWQGVVLWTPNLPGWHHVPVAEQVSRAVDRPVVLGNDANLAALAEQRVGAGRGYDEMVYLTVSTGIGGGIISGGRLMVGQRGFAGEIGHVVVDPGGPLCNCGRTGCLEAFASGTGIAREARARVNRGAATLIRDLAAGDVGRITARTVHEAALAGDSLAISLLAIAGRYLGLGIANLCVLLNPGIVVVGGSVTKAGDLLFQPALATIREQIDDVYRCPVVPAQLGDSVALVGAALLVRDHLAQLEE